MAIKSWPVVCSCILISMEQVIVNTNIALLLDSSGPGGIETHALELATGLNAFGLQVEVCLLQHYGPHPLYELLEQRGIRWRILGGGYRAIRKYLREQRPSLLHTHGYRAGLLGRIAARISSIPVVNTDHAGDPGRGRLRAYTWLDRSSSWMNHANIAVSEHVASQIRTDVTVMENFVQIPEIAQASGQQIAFVGRLSEEKGADIFIELAQSFSNRTFHIYGDGPLYDQLHDTADNVVFHGQQSSMENVWQQIGLLIMSSRNEGLPMAALEAMARGIPVLATNVGDLSNLIQTGENGWLVDEARAGSFLQPLNIWLQLKQPERQSLGLKARNAIESGYSPSRIIPKILDVYTRAGVELNR